MTKLRNEKYEYIKKVVTRTLLECNINTLPIDPYKICEKRGYKLIKYSEKYKGENFEKVCAVFPNGFNYFLEGERIIEYNDTLLPERIRTTIFHEIGHIELKHTCQCSLAETEAEWFAAYIIAPPPLIDLIKVNSLLELSIKFDTSKECAYHCMMRYIAWKRVAWFKRDYEKDLIEQFCH